MCGPLQGIYSLQALPANSGSAMPGLEILVHTAQFFFLQLEKNCSHTCAFAPQIAAEHAKTNGATSPQEYQDGTCARVSSPLKAARWWIGACAVAPKMAQVP